MVVMENFDEWKQFLKTRVEQARGLGMDDEDITSVASQIGEYLTTNVEPANIQERLLKEMWDAGDSSQREAMTQMIIHMVEREPAQ
ncbi:DUF3243 domain-containing protein [Pasteuria penetrans]|uniref:DUF3243 domain-containing protein n=1 Tax=Pasteuria penetrans TaxID=86005 RepID=UPI000FAC7C7B|nr:DUF3243 domain-containing protein [Pasteuria penetrans]